MKIAAFLVLALLALLAAMPAQAKRIPPRDDCIADALFAAFRTKLDGIIKHKDAKALLAVTAPDIDFSFGGEHGRAAFAREWKLDRPSSSPIWAELGHVLSRGCSLAAGKASAPYWFEHGPDGDIADVGLIDGERVNLRAAPSRTAKVIRTLDWERVMIGEQTQDGWAKVTLDDGAEGYVASELIWTGYSLRGLFGKRAGKWLLTVLIAGD